MAPSPTIRTAKFPRGCCLIAAIGCLLASGCSRGEVLGKVAGRVTFEGQPVSPGIVIFGNREKGVFMTAPLGEDGSYKIIMAKGEGLPLGDYQVAVAPPLPEESFGPPQQAIQKGLKFENIPIRYRRLETSPLRLEVRAGENPFNVDLSNIPKQQK